MAAQAIERGSLQALFNPSGNPPQTLVVQCVQIKAMDSKGGDERYRVVFSDVNNFIQSMVATQSNHYVTEGKLKKGSIVRLTRFNPNVVKGKRILIVIEMDILSQYGECDKIGEPVALDPVGEEAPVNAQPAGISSNGFYGNRQEPQQHQQNQQQQRQTALPSRPNNPMGPQGNLYPIEALSPYAHKWTIRARVTNKSDIRTWHNKNGEGKLFSVNLLDESGEIKLTGFNNECDTWYNIFQEGSVYYISSPCRVQMAKK
ncbi:hypothetical protein LTS18_000190, partial [Coniosporium uncinatum]